MVVISIILMPILFSCATTQQKQEELKDADFYITRGVAYCDKGQYDQAISDFTKALEINPRFAECYFKRGFAYVKKGLYDQAISDFNKVLEINQNLAEAYYNRGVLYSAKREYEKSLDDLKRAQELGFQVPPGIFDDIRKLSSDTSGSSRRKSYVGFGFWFSGLPNDYTIHAILENGPAARAGLKVGDRILKINDIDATAFKARRIHAIIYNVFVGEKWIFTVLQEGNEKQVELVAEEQWQ
jgi:tetratricopeptide (TPR) repeat protein